MMMMMVTMSKNQNKNKMMMKKFGVRMNIHFEMTVRNMQLLTKVDATFSEKTHSIFCPELLLRRSAGIAARVAKSECFG
jgi:hypothetical protein